MALLVPSVGPREAVRLRPGAEWAPHWAWAPLWVTRGELCCEVHTGVPSGLRAPARGSAGPEPGGRVAGWGDASGAEVGLTLGGRGGGAGVTDGHQPPSQVVNRLGLDSLSPFNPKERIIE